MFSNGNYLVTHYEGNPEMWNTKPPLLIWLQVLFFTLIGPSELALRLPSAFAALGVCITLYLFSIKYLKSTIFAFLACLILVTSAGYTQFHVTRTGDYDSLLILFMLCYALAFFAYTESRNKNYLFYLFLFLTLAVLTKSIQGLLFIPALFTYAVVFRKVHLFINKNIIIPALLFVFLVASYYLLREQYNEGYLQAVWENELGGRYFETNENHEQEFLFYFKLLYKYHFNYWFGLFLLGSACLLLPIKEELRKVGFFSLIVIFTYWLVISLSKTKLEWYESPMFPFLSILAAVPIYLGHMILLQFLRQKVIAFLVIGSMLFLIYQTPCVKTFNRTYYFKPFEWEKGTYEIGYILQQTLRNKDEFSSYDICFDGYHPHLMFYVYLLEKSGKTINSIRKDQLSPGDEVWISQPELMTFVESEFEFRIADEKYGAVKYELLLKKNL